MPSASTFEFWATVVLSVALIGGFIPIFFLTLGSRIEGQVVQNQMAYLMQSFASDIAAAAPPQTIAAMQAGLQNFDPNTPSLRAADAVAAAANEALIKKALTVLGIGFAVLMAIFIALIMMGRSVGVMHYKHIFGDAFGGLAVVAVTYYVFLQFFAAKFMSADANWAKLQMIQAVEGSINASGATIGLNASALPAVPAPPPSNNPQQPPPMIFDPNNPDTSLPPSEQVSGQSSDTGDATA
jgi:ABC-type multidrug transport system fused ATPase/permease subunit